MLRRKMHDGTASKYGNKPVTVDGCSFQSTLEAARYIDLKHQEKLGLISGLRRQVRVPLRSEGRKVGVYIADFVYFNNANEEVIEDVKGTETHLFKLKAALMAAQGQPVQIIKRLQIEKWARDTATEVRESGLPYSTEAA